MKHMRMLTWVLSVMAAACLCGCSKGQSNGSADAAASKPSTAVQEQSAAANRVSAQVASDVAEDSGKVFDFGADTVFGGIEIETDENGELVSSNVDGAVWQKVTDSRFPSYNKLRQFVNYRIGSGFMSDVDNYFAEKDGALYFVNGAAGREISSVKRYYFNDFDSHGGTKMTMSATHSAECRKKYGIYRSHADFVRQDGVWRLDKITLFLSN